MIVSSQQDQEDYAQRLNRLAFAHGLGFEGQTRVYPEDFIVDEELGFELDGEGPHLAAYQEVHAQYPGCTRRPFKVLFAVD